MVNYDNQPSIYEAVGNGSFLYRFNIQEVTPEVTGENENQEAQPSNWECEEVTVWPPVTANKIVKTVIASKWDADREQKLINEYNAAQLGLYGAKTSDEAKEKTQAYKDFLEARAALKTMVDADCEKLGIK